MEIWLTGIGLLLAGAGVLSARLCCYKKQLHHLLTQLQMAEQADTNLLLTSAVRIGETEQVISACNRVLEQHRSREEKLCRENRTYRESITSISHDIRTPLTSAKGYVQMLLNPKVPEEKRLSYTKIVERRLDDLAGMLDQLFLYARIEAGEIALQEEPINAGNLFAEAISLFYEDFLEKGCEPKVLLSREPCHIRADRQAFLRISENLIKNALVHGTGDYTFSLSRKGSKAALRVSNRTDTIEPGDIERIFDRFYTTDMARSRRTTGLGLAIVKEFTEKMGGEARAWLEKDLFSIEIKFDCIQNREEHSNA